MSHLREATREAQESLTDVQTNRDKLYRQIAAKAKDDALAEIAARIEGENEKLQNVTKQVADTSQALETTRAQLSQTEKSVLLNANKVRGLQTLLKSMRHSADRHFTEDSPPADPSVGSLVAESDALLATTVKLKLHLMDIRELKKLYNQNNKIIQDLLVKYQSRYTTKANMAIYRLMVISLEAELQNVLYNLRYSKLDKAIQDIKLITTRYQKIATDGNQNIAPTVNRFVGEIEYLFTEAIKIEYEYYIQKERMREEQKAIRDRMRQEAAERKLLEEERRKVEQEELKFQQEIANIQEQKVSTTDQTTMQQLEERLAKVQAQLEEVGQKKDDIITLQNGMAGCIYIISNLGAFGENIFKIGMTRRLDPQERVDELGDASVPFRFDVHSMIFSNAAPELENKLHKKLQDQRVNKVNLRKEFFRTTIDELEELVYSLEPSAEFNRTMIAEQFHQSMAVGEVPDSVDIIDDANGNDEEEE